MALTDIGRAETMNAGAQFTHAQFSTTEITEESIAARTASVGVVATLPISQLFIGPQTNYIAKDDLDSRSYVRVKSVWIWQGDPSQAGAKLMAVERILQNNVDKIANQDLTLNGSILLTNEQAANITLTALQVGAATTEALGLVEIMTDSEADSATPPGGSRVPNGQGVLRQVAAWWNRSGLLVELTQSLNDLRQAISTALTLKADIESPTLTGNPRAPTPATSDNDTSIATTAFVKAQQVAVPRSRAFTRTSVGTMTYSDVGFYPTEVEVVSYHAIVTSSSTANGDDWGTERGLAWAHFFRDGIAWNLRLQEQGDDVDATTSSLADITWTDTGFTIPSSRFAGFPSQNRNVRVIVRGYGLTTL